MHIGDIVKIQFDRELYFGRITDEDIKSKFFECRSDFIPLDFFKNIHLKASEMELSSEDELIAYLLSY